MLKTYLRYQQARSFGVIAAPSCNLVADRVGRLAVTGSLEDVVVWNVRRTSAVHVLHDESNTSQATSLAMSLDDQYVAAGCVYCLYYRADECWRDGATMTIDVPVPPRKDFSVARGRYGVCNVLTDMRMEVSACGECRKVTCG